jgi:hypothetical protein
MVDRKILEEILIKNCLIFHFLLGAGCRCRTGLCTRPTAAVPSRRGKAQHYSLIARCTWLFRAGKRSDFQTQRTVEDRKAVWFPDAGGCSGQECSLISRHKELWRKGKQSDFHFPDAFDCARQENSLISRHKGLWRTGKHSDFQTYGTVNSGNWFPNPLLTVLKQTH